MNNLIIFSNLQFDNLQGAAFMRLLNYSKALKSKYNIYLLTHNSFKISKKSSFNKISISDNLFLLTPSLFHKHNKLHRLLLRPFNFLGSHRFVKISSRYLSAQSIYYDTILYYGTDLPLALELLFQYKVKEKKRVFIEKSELEIGIVLNHSYSFNFSLLLFPMQMVCAYLMDEITRCFSGVIVISKKLQHRYRFSNNIYIPILTEIPELIVRQNNSMLYIGFTGTLSRKKDGIFDFIEALGRLTPSDTESIKLNVYGYGSEKELKTLQKLIEKKNLTRTVSFKKTVPAEKVYEILCNHDLLIITRSSNIQTEYGFSTKLAEYLSTGVPVLTTKVSDNSLYLIDNENALLIEPGDIDAMTSKIQFVLKNREVVKKLGLAGRETAKAHFNYKLYSEVLCSFFERLN